MNTIRIKRGAGDPPGGWISDGEFAFDTQSERLFIGREIDTTDQVELIELGGRGSFLSLTGSKYVGNQWFSKLTGPFLLAYQDIGLSTEKHIVFGGTLNSNNTITPNGNISTPGTISAASIGITGLSTLGSLQVGSSITSLPLGDASFSGSIHTKGPLLFYCTNKQTMKLYRPSNGHLTLSLI